MKDNNKFAGYCKVVLHWVVLYKWFLMLVVSVFILPIFGDKLNVKKTVKSQAEKAGFVFENTKSPVVLTQEYPEVAGRSYRDSLNLSSNNPALMNWRENEQPFWLGIQSQRKDKKYNNPTLFLDFKGKADVRVDQKESAGWVEMDPDFTYFIKGVNIQPMTGIRLNPLFIKFPEEGIYFVQYTIAGDDEIPTRGVFHVEVQ